jgi:uncharacterized protein (DUF1800 family)
MTRWALAVLVAWGGSAGAKPSDSQAKVVHLLNRLAFGPSPSDVAEVERVGVDRWIDQQLHPDVIQDPEVKAALDKLPALAMDAPELSLRYPRRAGNQEAPGGDQMAPLRPEQRAAEIGRELAAQKLIRAVQSRRQLEEVLDDFWFNHFNVSEGKGRTLWYLISYERDVLRPHLFGKFRDLLGATTHAPAMLFYLDNWTSVREGFRPRENWRRLRQADQVERPRGLNENYARELMELHTLGVRGGYTQQDVRELARALTGWGIDKPWEGGGFAFHRRAHDDDSKQIMTLPLASGGGIEDGEAVLDLLARHPATARHLAFKLCQRFVADQPPPALVERVAQVYLRTDGDLRQVYRAIFDSPEFWTTAAMNTKIKTPLELVVSAIRSVGGTVDEHVGMLARTLQQMGQPLYQAQPPTGYKETSEAWVSAGALVQRINFGISLAQGLMNGVTIQVPIPVACDDLDATVDALAAQVLRRPLSSATHRTVVAALSGRRDPGLDRQAPPDIARAVGLLWGSPEFQRQ